jgi:hypothetical protein
MYRECIERKDYDSAGRKWFFDNKKGGEAISEDWPINNRI